jgi:hypothetical protein
VEGSNLRQQVQRKDHGLSRDCRVGQVNHVIGVKEVKRVCVASWRAGDCWTESAHLIEESSRVKRFAWGGQELDVTRAWESFRQGSSRSAG